MGSLENAGWVGREAGLPSVKVESLGIGMQRKKMEATSVREFDVNGGLLQR